MTEAYLVSSAFSPATLPLDLPLQGNRLGSPSLLHAWEPFKVGDDGMAVPLPLHPFASVLGPFLCQEDKEEAEKIGRTQTTDTRVEARGGGQVSSQATFPAFPA